MFQLLTKMIHNPSMLASDAKKISCALHDRLVEAIRRASRRVRGVSPDAPPPATLPLRRFLVTYRVKLGHLSLVGEMKVETRRAKWDIDAAKIVSAYIAKMDEKHSVSFDGVIDMNEFPSV